MFDRKERAKFSKDFSVTAAVVSSAKPRFRLFECDRDATGRLVTASEVLPDRGTIDWEVHLANRKAAAPRFLDSGGQVNLNPANRRNGATGNDQSDTDLVIDPGSRVVSATARGPALFDGGKFRGVSVPLGEIRAESSGRLIVIGGFGTSGSQPIAPLDGSIFADNDNWYDDTSDGPSTPQSSLLTDAPCRRAPPGLSLANQTSRLPLRM